MQELISKLRVTTCTSARSAENAVHVFMVSDIKNRSFSSRFHVSFSVSPSSLSLGNEVNLH